MTSLPISALDPSEKFVIVANYGSGSVAVFERLADGSLGTRVALAVHSGSGPNAERQDAAHTHQVLFDPATSHAMVCDLGSDTVFRYAVGADGSLTEPAGSRILFRPGSGPRHGAFHPGARFFFVVTELANTVVAFRREGDGFAVTDEQSTLPADYVGESTSGGIQVSPSGRFVFSSNRGADSIAVFSFDERSGSLQLVHVVPSGGRTPRDIRLAPDGSQLLVANQDSDDITVFQVDGETGALVEISTTSVPTPTCICILH